MVVSSRHETASLLQHRLEKEKRKDKNKYIKILGLGKRKDQRRKKIHVNFQALQKEDKIRRKKEVELF